MTNHPSPQDTKRGFATFTPDRLRSHLLAQRSDSVEWSDDATFRDHWLNNTQLVYLFCRLNRTFMSVKSEGVVFDKPLTVEQSRPASWTCGLQSAQQYSVGDRSGGGFWAWRAGPECLVNGGFADA